MSSRSLNKVTLIGNLTRDPELRYTPQGTAVCTFGVATNRSWLPEGATERREETEFHRIVAWNKLAELCAQLLAKGRKVYVEGRLSTRSWTSPDGAQRMATEIVIDDMIILDSRRAFEESQAASLGTRAATASPLVAPTTAEAPSTTPAETPPPQTVPAPTLAASDSGKKKKKAIGKGEEQKEEIKEEKKEESILNTDDIPF